MQQGMSFFDAVYYQNLDLGRTAEVAATAGSVALAAVTVGPALIVAGGEALTGVGSLSGSAAVYYAGVHTSAAGERLLNTLWSTGPIHPLTHAQDRALRRLSTEADEEFTLCGGYGETIEGIHGRAEAAMKNLPNTEVRELMMPSWRNTGVPGGKDVDLWNEPSTQVGEGIRRILGFQGEFDLYSQYPEWQYHLPYASKTYYPDGSMYQHWAPWGKIPQ
jgi:hypothetical protein